MANVLAKILVYGDIHLSSRNHGGHVDYPEESLHYFQRITQRTREHNVTHLIGTGDLTFGRFHTLEYREKVEKELKEQFKLVNGNRYEVKGNHDSATYGMTEYEYYVNKGLLLPSTNLKIGKANISMVDSGMYYKHDILDTSNKDETNIVIAHDYFKFKDTQMPNYGKAIELDTFTDWYGVHYLICGHIHKHEIFEGSIIKNGYGFKTLVHYLGSMPRPSYREGHTDDTGYMALITVTDDGEVRYEVIEEELWSLEKSFNLSKKEKEKEKQAEKEQRINISDIVNSLNTHERNVGNPEDIIASLEGIDEKYKNKAIELLKLGGA